MGAHPVAAAQAAETWAQSQDRCFRRFVRRMLFQTIHDASLMLDRERVGREVSPSGDRVPARGVAAALLSSVELPFRLPKLAN